MRKLFLLLSLGVFLFSCKEAKKETKPSPYQPLADQYAEFPLTTDLSQLTENEKKMIPILIEVADIMENIFWQNAYGDKSALMAQFAQDSAALKYLSINYGPWDRLNDNKPFIDGVGAKPLGANFYPADMAKEEFDALDDPRKRTGIALSVGMQPESLSCFHSTKLTRKKWQKHPNYWKRLPR